MNFSTILRVDIREEWEAVSAARSFIDQLITIKTKEAHRAKIISAAASELMENAYKYSSLGYGLVTLAHCEEEDKFRLSVINIARGENITSLTEILEFIREGDPSERYKEMMIRSLNNIEKSQLGLARIRAECDANIAIDISDTIPSYILNKFKCNEQEIIKNMKLVEVSITV